MRIFRGVILTPSGITLILLRFPCLLEKQISALAMQYTDRCGQIQTIDGGFSVVFFPLQFLNGGGGGAPLHKQF